MCVPRERERYACFLDPIQPIHFKRPERGRVQIADSPASLAAGAEMADSAQSANSCKALVRALCGKVFLGDSSAAEHWQGLGKGNNAREDAWMRHLEARAYEILLDLHDVRELERMAGLHGRAFHSFVCQRP